MSAKPRLITIKLKKEKKNTVQHKDRDVKTRNTKTRANFKKKKKMLLNVFLGMHHLLFIM